MLVLPLSGRSQRAPISCFSGLELDKREKYPALPRKHWQRKQNRTAHIVLLQTYIIKLLHSGQCGLGVKCTGHGWSRVQMLITLFGNKFTTADLSFLKSNFKQFLIKYWPGWWIFCSGPSVGFPKITLHHGLHRLIKAKPIIHNVFHHIQTGGNIHPSVFPAYTPLIHMWSCSWVN